MKLNQITIGVLFLVVTIWTKSVADLAPKPIKDTGVWNDPARFRLVENHVSITLDKDAAKVKACFFFISTKELHYWDMGLLEWAWPLPPEYPRPTQFNVLSNSRPTLPKFS